MDRLAGAVVGEGGVAVRGSSFLMGIFHLLYTFLSPVPYSQLSISFMINRYARKLLTLSLGIMLITKSNLCKKKKKKRQVAVGGWARDAWEEGRRSWRQPSPSRWVSCQAWQLVGTEGFRWTPPGLGYRYTHLPALRQAPCCQAGVSPESQLPVNSAVVQTQTSSSLRHAMVLFIGLFCGHSAGHVES